MGRKKRGMKERKQNMDGSLWDLHRSCALCAIAVLFAVCAYGAHVKIVHDEGAEAARGVPAPSNGPAAQLWPCRPHQTNTFMHTYVIPLFKTLSLQGLMLRLLSFPHMKIE